MFKKNRKCGNILLGKVNFFGFELSGALKNRGCEKSVYLHFGFCTQIFSPSLFKGTW